MHLFMPQDTIKGAIRKHNNMISESSIINDLLKAFNQLNGHHVPRPGQVLKIPIYEESAAETQHVPINH